METPWSKAKHRQASTVQEKRLASRKGGSAQINSGRVWFSKRDNKFYSFLIEARTTTAASYSIKVLELKKLTRDAFFHKNIPALNIEFEKEDEDWTLIRTVDFEDMHERILVLEALLEKEDA